MAQCLPLLPSHIDHGWSLHTGVTSVLRLQRPGQVLEVRLVYAGPLFVKLAGELEGPFLSVHGEMR
jgi:hypothetical protein